MNRLFATLLYAVFFYHSYAGDTSAHFMAVDTVVQNTTATDTLNTVKKGRVWVVAGANVVFWTGTYIALDKAWYSDYPKSPFHFFNDNQEWLQMDKFGHVWTAYQLSRVSGALWKWTGLNHTTSTILGGISGVAYQSIIEIQDGFSSEWGFSWGDMTANVIGASAYVAQELGWKDQRIQIKLSYWPYNYPTDLIPRRDELFGVNPIERLLKDYNSQTYWINFNLKSFFPSSHLPAWLNLSAGYSADGMLGATENVWTDKDGVIHDYTSIPRVRRFLLSADVDLTKIKTKSKLLRTIFFAFNMVKVPAPALELDSRGKFTAHLLYY